MARPTIPRNNQKRSPIQIRLTDAERTTFDQIAFAEHCSLTDLIKQRVLGTEPKRRKATPERAILIKGIGDLGRIGGNINQIAKALNEGRGFEIPAGDISRALMEITNLSNRIIDAIENGN